MSGATCALYLSQVQPLCGGWTGGLHLPADPQFGTTSLDVKQETSWRHLRSCIAYEISPSFDIRAEYRGMITKVPTFDYSVLNTTSGTTSTIRPWAWLTTSSAVDVAGIKKDGPQAHPFVFDVLKPGRPSALRSLESL